MKIRHEKAKPIRQDLFRRLPITRVPPSEPLTPGLRRRELTSAIGFHHSYDDPDDTEEYKKKGG